MHSHNGHPRIGRVESIGERRDVPPATRALVIAVIAWSMAWKGASLWWAARTHSKPWFVALLLTNTLGVLDAIYLFAVSGRTRR
jgi:hypothetical protein